MTSQEIYKFLQKFYLLDVRMIRNNLRTECALLYKKYNGRKNMLKKLNNISKSTFNAMLNTSCETKIDLEKFIQIVGVFDLNLEKILTEQPLPITITKNKENKKKIFIEYYETNGNKKTAEHYNLKLNSVETYYKAFNNNSLK